MKTKENIILTSKRTRQFYFLLYHSGTNNKLLYKDQSQGKERFLVINLGGRGNDLGDRGNDLGERGNDLGGRGNDLGERGKNPRKQIKLQKRAELYVS
jgi:hypothetical protein